MRRSTNPSLMPGLTALSSAVLRHRGRIVLMLMLAIGLGVGIWSGGDHALAQGDGYEMHIYVTNCQIVPPLPPTLNEAGCVPAVGAYVELIGEDGTWLGACSANEVFPNGQVSGCTVIVPYNTRGQAHLDMSSIEGNYAPQYNPLYFHSGGPEPPDGIPGYPYFINVLVSDGGGGEQPVEQPVEQSGQTQPVQQEQTAPADRFATVISGTCAEPGDGVDESIGVYIPQGDPLGLPTALIAESGGGSIGVALDDLFASPHAIIVVTPTDGEGTKVACGDLGTVADDDAIAVIGLHPAQGSEMGGIAYLATDQSTGRTLVSIFLAEGLG